MKIKIPLFDVCMILPNSSLIAIYYRAQLMKNTVKKFEWEEMEKVIKTEIMLRQSSGKRKRSEFENNPFFMRI